MSLENNLKQLEAYYPLCNYESKLICADLINGINDILKGKKLTVDAYASTPEELDKRVYNFLMEIDKHISVTL
ncbi:hypothetical protein HEMROJRC1_20500 [Rodentibacter sp. JRC1]|uniref:hypothetical protein n=1 Tax=Rodentibacter sp. JRC1 TaxID=2874504 RepID=UPI001CFCB2C7|nr:hypothetical protein [Rodentibacter sp. JRC1]GJI56938.1 hypothetical protein HEMROJRC1_20500 [Rodentibacter sp. JRC1]